MIHADGFPQEVVKSCTNCVPKFTRSRLRKPVETTRAERRRRNGRCHSGGDSPRVPQGAPRTPPSRRQMTPLTSFGPFESFFLPSRPSPYPYPPPPPFVQATPMRKHQGGCLGLSHVTFCPFCLHFSRLRTPRGGCLGLPHATNGVLPQGRGEHATPRIVHTFL